MSYFYTFVGGALIGAFALFAYTKGWVKGAFDKAVAAWKARGAK